MSTGACTYVSATLCCACWRVPGAAVYTVAAWGNHEHTLDPARRRGTGTALEERVSVRSEEGCSAGSGRTHGGSAGVWWPSLPAGAALGQTLQNGLQVLLVGADLGKVTLKGLDLQLLLLGLLLQQPQFPMQGPGRAQPEPQALQCPLGLIQSLGWGSMGVQGPCRGTESLSVGQLPAGPKILFGLTPQALHGTNRPGSQLPTVHQETEGPSRKCGEVDEGLVRASCRVHRQVLELPTRSGTGQLLIFVIGITTIC